MLLICPDLPENQDYASTAARIIHLITLQIHTSRVKSVCVIKKWVTPLDSLI